MQLFCVWLAFLVLTDQTSSLNAEYWFHTLVCVCSVAQSCPLFATPRTVVHRAPLPMEFSRQEYWSGLPFPFLGNLLDPGREPKFLASPALMEHLKPFTSLLFMIESVSMAVVSQSFDQVSSQHILLPFRNAKESLKEVIKNKGSYL